MEQIEARFSLAELVDATGLPARTIRQYITDGLVPPALGRGRARYFTSDHLERLAQVMQLRDQRLSLDEIRVRLLAVGSASDESGETWVRLSLHPDLELHVRMGASESVQNLAGQLRRHAAEWFGDE